MRISFKTTVDMSAFERAAKTFQNVTLPAVVERANRDGAELAVLVARRKHEHTDRTGDLVKPENLFFRVGRRTGRFVGFELVNKMPYAWAIEKKAEPHVIEAKNAKALVFRMIGGEGRGKFFVGQRVNWKGDRTYPFMFPAYEVGKAFTAAKLARNIPIALRSAWS